MIKNTKAYSKQVSRHERKQLVYRICTIKTKVYIIMIDKR